MHCSWNLCNKFFKKIIVLSSFQSKKMFLINHIFLLLTTCIESNISEMF